MRRRRKSAIEVGGGAFKQGDIPPPNCLWLRVSEEHSNLPVLESENNINKSLQRLWTGMKNWSKPAELKTCVKQPAHINHWPGLRHPLAAPSQFLAFPLNRLHRIFSFSFSADCAVNNFLCLSYSMQWTISVVLSCLGKHGVIQVLLYYYHQESIPPSLCFTGDFFLT